MNKSSVWSLDPSLKDVNLTYEKAKAIVNERFPEISISGNGVRKVGWSIHEVDVTVFLSLCEDVKSLDEDEFMLSFTGHKESITIYPETAYDLSELTENARYVFNGSWYSAITGERLQDV